MNTITVWLLIAVSSGYYNKGSVTVVGQFATHDDCNMVASQMVTGQSVITNCIKAKVVKP